MENYVLASNSDNRIEAFFVQNGVVKHTWQKNPSNKEEWTLPSDLTSQNGKTPGHQPPKNVTKVEACSNMEGFIHVIAYAADGKNYTCYQSKNAWNGWYEITQS